MNLSRPTVHRATIIVPALALASACAPSGAYVEPTGDEVAILIRNGIPQPLAIYSSHLRARIATVEPISTTCIVTRLPATGATLSARPQASSAAIESAVIVPSRMGAVTWTINTNRTSPLNVMVPAASCRAQGQ